MPASVVLRNEFDWVNGWIVHRPTQAQFKLAYPGSESEQFYSRWGTAGDTLADGTYYKREEVAQMAVMLLKQKSEEH